MTTQEERTGSSPGAAADVQVRVPRRPKSWGSKVRWTRHTAQPALVTVVGWQAVGHLTSGSESAEAWCPLGGIEGAWTVLTTELEALALQQVRDNPTPDTQGDRPIRARS